MIRKLRRRSDTGRFTTAADAQADPAGTTIESVRPPFTPEHHEALRCLAACANKHGLRETIRRLNA